jgi:hypothetical protein
MESYVYDYKYVHGTTRPGFLRSDRYIFNRLHQVQQLCHNNIHLALYRILRVSP